MTNSIKKGKRGERELCRALREQGYGAIRSQQVAGISSIDKTADILTSLPHVRWEVKRTSAGTKLSHQSVIDDWVQTAQEETPDEQLWVVAWRPDHGKWRFFMDPEPIRVTHYPTSDTVYSVDAPYVLFPTLDAVVTAVDPHVHHTVNDPGDWMPDDETQLA